MFTYENYLNNIVGASLCARPLIFFLREGVETLPYKKTSILIDNLDFKKLPRIYEAAF
jgi:hypothetical protein